MVLPRELVGLKCVPLGVRVPRVVQRLACRLSRESDVRAHLLMNVALFVRCERTALYLVTKGS
jgi:hypothetical protein